MEPQFLLNPFGVERAFRQFVEKPQLDGSRQDF
jgi:hypothetical protein